MRDDEVLATGLADEARIVAVPVDVAADLPPQVLEGPGGAGEVDARQVLVGQNDIGDRVTVAVDQVDDAGRSPAASRSAIVYWAEYACVGDGFHTTVFPISIGAVDRFAAMAVKLNGGVTA